MLVKLKAADLEGRFVTEFSLNSPGKFLIKIEFAEGFTAWNQIIFSLKPLHTQEEILVQSLKWALSRCQEISLPVNIYSRDYLSTLTI